MAQDAVDGIEEVFGTYAGHRRAHARGKTFRGIFQATGLAEQWTEAAHFSGAEGETEAFIRFSHFSPDPTWADAMSPVKGMAVQLQDRTGAPVNVVGVTSPVFFASTPESFMEMLNVTRTAKKGRPNLKDLFSLLTDYPEARGMLEALKKFHAPAGFGAGRYHSIHVYYFVDGEGNRQPVKYIWEPLDGARGLSAVELASLPIGFYEADIEDRVRSGPLRFQLKVVLGQPEDPTDDPTKQWPEDRESHVIGELAILEEEPAAEALLFDPTQVTEGIECSEDPILRFRHPAYSVSYSRRTEENK